MPAALADCDDLLPCASSMTRDTHLTSDVLVRRDAPLFHHPTYGPHLHEAYAQARRLGLSAEDSEDCAMSFLVHELTKDRTLCQQSHLRRRCAHDFACDCWRAIQRRRAREVVQSEIGEIGGPERGANGNDSVRSSSCLGQPTPEQEVLRHAAWNLLHSLLSALESLPQQVMRRHHFAGESVACIAGSLNKSVGSVEQVLWRARHRLRGLLHEAGVQAADLLLEAVS